MKIAGTLVRGYFDSLKTQVKELANPNGEINKKKRVQVSRRYRLHKIRTKHIPEVWRESWKLVTPECMSDVESDDDGRFYYRTVMWRIDEVKEAIQVIDSELGVTRVYGEPSTRKPSSRGDRKIVVEFD